jgi:hypothetical protein
MADKKKQGRGARADARGTNAGNRFGDEQAQGRGDDRPLPPERSGVDGEMDDSCRTHNPVTLAEEIDDNLGLPDLDIAGFGEDNYSMGTDPKAVGDRLDQIEIPHDRETEGDGEPQ